MLVLARWSFETEIILFFLIHLKEVFKNKETGLMIFKMLHSAERVAAVS